MRRKKKGSSLVLVVFISALIIATATMMLTVVSSDFKSRVNRSKRIKSLYEADSGQNYVKNIIQKESDLAIIYANSEIYNKYCRDTGLVTDLNIEDEFIVTKADTDNILLVPIAELGELKNGQEFSFKEI